MILQSWLRCTNCVPCWLIQMGSSTVWVTLAASDLVSLHQVLAPNFQSTTTRCSTSVNCVLSYCSRTMSLSSSKESKWWSLRISSKKRDSIEGSSLRLHARSMNIRPSWEFISFNTENLNKKLIYSFWNSLIRTITTTIKTMLMNQMDPDLAEKKNSLTLSSLSPLQTLVWYRAKWLLQNSKHSNPKFSKWKVQHT